MLLKQFLICILVFASFLLFYTPTFAANIHEARLENLDLGILPKEIREKLPKKETSIFSPLKDFVGFVKGILGFQVNNPQNFALRMGLHSKVSVPTEALTPEGALTNQSPYGEDIPELEGFSGKTTKDWEDLYAKSYFPEGVNPFAQ